MIKADIYYKANLTRLLGEGCIDKNPRPKYKDGEPAHTRFITHVFEEYDISQGEFPLTTLRNTATKTGIIEMLWIYQKQSNSLSLARDMGLSWWGDWDIGDDTIGKRYGYVVKNLGLMDTLLEGLINDPFGRRHIIDLWQEEYMEGPGLKPCAYSTTWSVRRVGEELYLDLLLNQRSSDFIVAGYINKIQYTALLMMVARHCNMKPGKFSHMVANLHFYERHAEALMEILRREPLSVQPKLILKDGVTNFWDMKIDDFTIEGIEGITKLKSNLELAI